MKSHAISGPRDFPDAPAAAVQQAAAGEAASGTGAAFVDTYLPALLAQAHHLVSREFHAVASVHGFSPSEWRVLATLASGDPMSIGRLARLTVIKQSTLTRVLDRMEAADHVRRVPHPADRRITLVALSPAGTKAAAQLIPLAREHERRVLEPFGRKRGAELKETLLHLIEMHAQAAEDGPDAEDA
jgi:DNA-binding MarR family transcriptional regulator